MTFGEYDSFLRKEEKSPLTRNEIKVLRCLADPTFPSVKTTNIERKPFIGSTRAAVIFLAYQRRQESTFPFHGKPRGRRGVGGQ